MANRRQVKIELQQKRVRGPNQSRTAYDKNRHVFQEADDVANLVQVAYQYTDELNADRQRRYDAASHNEINSAAWQALTHEERGNRDVAFAAITEAQAAVAALIKRENGSRGPAFLNVTRRGSVSCQAGRRPQRVRNS